MAQSDAILYSDGCGSGSGACNDIFNDTNSIYYAFLLVILRFVVT